MENLFKLTVVVPVETSWYDFNEITWNIGWITYIYFIMCYLDNEYRRACIWCAIYDLILTCLYLLFVDDEDPPNMINKSSETCDFVMNHHQDKVMFWDGGLWVIE